MTENLFAQFQRRLTALGGEVVHAGDIAQAAQLIAEYARQGDGSVVVPPARSDSLPVGADLSRPGVGTGRDKSAPTGSAIPLWQQAIPFLRDSGITIRESTGPTSVADAPVGLSSAALAIAETGSVMLAENALEARVVGMLTLTHIVLVAERDIVPMLDDAGARLQQLTKTGPNQQHYISFVTGPSRTSDIERVLTIGVQGPKSLCVIVVGTDSSHPAG